MAKKYLTTDSLIASVKNRGQIPSSQQTFTTDDFLSFINEELDITVVPHILKFQEEYFVYTELIPIQANTSRYPIPTRAVGNKLRELAYQDNSGNIFEMTQVRIDDLPAYQNSAMRSQFSMFYPEGSDIVLIPDAGPNPTGFLRFSYYLRPNLMVSESRVAIVSSINLMSGEITVDKIPSNITVVDPLDIIQTNSPHKSLAINKIPLAINTVTKVIQFTPSDIPPELRKGDHIALAEETIVPQIPSDLHSMLAQQVAARCLEALGDTQGLAAANSKLVDMEMKTGTLIDNRVAGAPLKIRNNSNGLLRRRRRF